MKRLRYILSIYMLLALPAAAQDRQQTRFEKIEAAKVAFITKELSLTPKEAQQFFPVYNQYQKDIHAVIRKRKEQRGNGERPKPRRGELEYDAEVLQLKKRYQKDFSQVVGDDRASRFFEAERAFREKLFKELEERRAKEKQ